MRLTLLSMFLVVSLAVVSPPVLGQEFSSNLYNQTSGFGQSACSASSDCACQQCQSQPRIRFLCDPPGCGSRNWFNVDFLLLHSNGYSVPSLVTSSPDGTARPHVGQLDDPATTNLLGNERIGDNLLPGLQLSFGHWLDDCGNKAITGSIFALGSGEDMQMFPSDPNQIVSRPFFNTNPSVNAWDSELVNMPGVVDGKIAVTTDSSIFSANIGLQKKLCCCGDPCSGYARRTDFFVGYRVFGMDESLTISESLNPVGGLIPAGTQFDVIDQFETENRFHGVELGLMNTWQKNRWTLSAMGKVALGNVNQRAIINGSTTITVPTVDPVVQPYGILASTSNIGTYERNRFGVLTQAQLEIGYQINWRTRVKLGYNAIFLNDAVRPGSLIDLNVNSTQFDPNVPVSGPATPTFDWKSESVYLHGFNAGLEFVF